MRNSHNEALYKTGNAMGFVHTGKGTSSPMKSMDHATTQRTESSNQLDVETGGKTPVRPGFKNGGKVKLSKVDKQILKTKHGGSYTDTQARAYLKRKAVPKGNLMDLAKKYRAGTTSRMEELGLAKGGKATSKKKGGYNSEPMYGKDK